MRYLFGFLILFIALTAKADITHVKYLAISQGVDESYYLEMLEQALSHTEEEYGAYDIYFSEEQLSAVRKQDLLLKGERVNIDRLVGFPNSDALRKKLILVDYPLLYGFMGYRIPLIQKDSQALFDNVQNRKDLESIRLGIGKGWEEYVYQFSHFPTTEVLNSSMLFKMLLGKRFDYIPLSAIEIDDHYIIDGKFNVELQPEKRILFHIDLPLYFYVSPQHPQLAERLAKGLKSLDKNGRAKEIFNKHFKDKLKKLQLSERLVIDLPNPKSPNIMPDDDHSLISEY